MTVSLEPRPDVRVRAEEAPSPVAEPSDGGVHQRIRSALDHAWADRRIALAASAALVIGWALITGWWMPRGPVTAGQALTALGVGALLGAAVGLLVRRRWVALAAPLLYVLVFELVRVDLVGPTVDRPRFSAYGLLAFVVGRGFHGLVALLPLAWGAVVGRRLAGRLSPEPGEPVHGLRRALRGTRTAVAALVGVALVALAVGLARPATTAAIEGPDGSRLAGSIAELTTVSIDGREHPLMIRGHSVDAPVLLFLAGGPGGSELGAMRNHLPELEEHFVVVTWDQPGTGKAYPGLDPTGDITLEGYVDDTLAVTDHLRERFGQDQILLVGQSWGSTLGVLAVQQAPERYRALVGVGQMVSQRATDVLFWEDTLAWARATGRDGLAGTLERIGPPPYDDMLDYETALSWEHEVYPMDHTVNHEGQGGFSENFLVPEYRLIEQVHLLAGFMDTFAVLYPQLQQIDFRRTATELDVPMFFVQGVHEARGRAEPFEEWYDLLDAPVKDVTYLDTSGHRPMFQQPEEFVSYLVDTVLTRS
jgi:proline iminopeptidase